MGLSGSGYFNLGNGIANAAGGLFGNKSSSSDIFAGAQNPFQDAQELQLEANTREADLIDQQAGLALEEAGQTALAKGREAGKFADEQANQYNISGVRSDTGSPLMVANETRRLAAQEVDAIVNRGAAIANLYKQRAMIQRNEGRAQLLGLNTKFSAARAQAQIEAIKNQPGIFSQLALFGQQLAQTSKTTAGAGAAGSRKKLTSSKIPAPNTMLGTPHSAIPQLKLGYTLPTKFSSPGSIY